MELNRFYLNLVRRWLWLLVLAPLVIGVTSYWVIQKQPPVYKAAARLLVGPGLDSLNPDVNSFRTAGQLMHTYAEVAKTWPMLQAIRDELNLGISPDALGNQIELTPNNETRILSVYVRDSDPQRAITIANAVANSLVNLSPASNDTNAKLRAQLEVQATKVQEIIDSTEARLKELEASSQATTDVQAQRLILDQIAQERNRLSDAHRTLTLLYDSLQVGFTNQMLLIEPAIKSIRETSQAELTTLMAALAGLILALMIAVGFQYFADTLTTVEELAQATDAPSLGAFARHPTWPGTGPERLIVRALPQSRAAEDYRMLGTKLLFSKNGSGALHSVLISSAQANDNTGELAANMAITLAQAGSRVILMDANLRQPTIAQLFGIVARRGLNEMLTDASQPLELVAVDGVPGLSVLPSGSALPGPFDLLASPQMTNLIEQLKEQADFLIIAAAPLLSFADSLILASRVDGVIVVARSGATSRKVMVKAAETLHSIGVYIIGTVLDDSRHSNVRFTLARRGPTASVPTVDGGSVIEDALTRPTEDSDSTDATKPVASLTSL